MSVKAPYVFVILGALFFFSAEPLAAQAAALNQAIPFNTFLAAWIDVFMYVLAVISLSLGLSSLDF